MVVAILILFFTIFGFCGYCYLERKRKFRSLHHLPGPTGYPIIGSALEFGFSPVDIYQAYIRLPKQYGSLFRIWIGPKKCCIMVSDPDFLEFLLTSPKHIFKSVDYDLLQPWLCNGLLLSTGGYWQKRRKIITPAFHFKILEQFNVSFLSDADILVERLSAEVGKGVFDIYPYITDFTLDTICETAMGTSVHAQKSTDNAYVTAIRDLTQLLIVRMFSAWKAFDTLYKFSYDYKKYKKCLKTIHDFTRGVIEKRREVLLSDIESNTENEADEFGVKRKVAFLDVLLKSTIDGKPLSNEDIREEVDTFMFEGHDTTSSSLGFICYELSRNPRVQNKIVNEFHELFGNDKNRQLSVTDLNNMKYTDLVIKETLRLHSAVPIFGRQLKEDVYFKGTHLPKDLQIIVLLISLHRRADLYKDPETFYPERFLENNDSVKNPFTYLPFSAGPRNCIGQRYAMNEMKVALYKILCHYELFPADKKYDVIPMAELTLKSANGIYVELKNRKF